MLNPSAERELTENYRLSKEKARQWWNNQAFESRKNIVIESDAVINDDQEVEDQMVADVADSDYDNLPDVTQQEIDSKIDDEEDVEQIFDLEGESYLQCSKCDDMFTSNEDYDIHKSVDHGEDPEDFEESEETYQLTMHPELTRESLREANNLLTETEERQLYSGYDKNGEIQSSVMPYNLPPVATGKYNDNPNEFFYSNKIFRAGSSSLRTSSLGEAKANEGLIYARIFNFEAEIQLVAEGKNKELTEEEALRIKNQYNMKTIYATATSNRGYIGYVDESEFGIGEAKASEGRTVEQVWNQSSPSQRESIMIEGGIEYEETGQSYFGDDGNDSDSLLHNLDDSGTDSGRWSAQNKSAMDSLSNTSYNNLPINIRDRVDSGIISYGLNLEGESKASESYTPDTQLFWDEQGGNGIMSQEEWGEKFYELDLKYVGLAKDNGYDFDENGQLITESKSSEKDHDGTVWSDFYGKWVDEDVISKDRRARGFQSGESRANEGVTYVYKIDKGNSNVNVNELAIQYSGKVDGDEISIPNPSSYDFSQHLKQLNIDYTIIGVRDVPTTEDGTVIDGTHSQYDKDDWESYESKESEVDYEEVKYEDDGVSDISVPNAEPKGADANEFLDNVSFGVESIDYVYPTKANETKDKSYITESEPYEEEYEEFEDSDEETIEETISIRKLTGYSDNSIARELHINYGVSHEEALEKVYSVEVSTNDRVAQTFFGKMYKECTESEKDELRMYSGSD